MAGQGYRVLEIPTDDATGSEGKRKVAAGTMLRVLEVPSGANGTIRIGDDDVATERPLPLERGLEYTAPFLYDGEGQLLGRQPFSVLLLDFDAVAGGLIKIAVGRAGAHVGLSGAIAEGVAGHGAPAAGNPFRFAGRYRATPAQVDDGDVDDVLTDGFGRVKIAAARSTLATLINTGKAAATDFFAAAVGPTAGGSGLLRLVVQLDTAAVLQARITPAGGSVFTAKLNGGNAVVAGCMQSLDISGLEVGDTVNIRAATGPVNVDFCRLLELEVET